MRLRERYAHLGPTNLGDAELIALLLGTGAGGQTATGIATALLDQYGGLAGLSRAEPAQLQRVHGVGPVRALQLHAALTLGQRAQEPRTTLPAAVTTPEAAVALLAPAMRSLEDEELHALYLDRRRRPVVQRALTRGSDGFTVVDPRQVFRVAIRTGASAVILAHNHPSGDPEPSAQDLDVTDRVARAGRVLGVTLLDHLVIGGARWVSLAARGRLPTWTTTEPAWTA